MLCSTFRDITRLIVGRQQEEVKHLENGEMQEVDELIADGKAEESENR